MPRSSNLPQWLLPLLILLGGLLLLSLWLGIGNGNSQTAPREKILSIRGATTSYNDTTEEIHAASEEMVLAMLNANNLTPKDLVEGFFSMTPVNFPLSSPTCPSLIHKDTSIHPFLDSFRQRLSLSSFLLLFSPPSIPTLLHVSSLDERSPLLEGLPRTMLKPGRRPGPDCSISCNCREDAARSAYTAVWRRRGQN